VWITEPRQQIKGAVQSEVDELWMQCRQPGEGFMRAPRILRAR
jgi:hypothetical protein